MFLCSKRFKQYLQCDRGTEVYCFAWRKILLEWSWCPWDSFLIIFICHELNHGLIGFISTFPGYICIVQISGKFYWNFWDIVVIYSPSSIPIGWWDSCPNFYENAPMKYFYKIDQKSFYQDVLWWNKLKIVPEVMVQCFSSCRIFECCQLLWNHLHIVRTRI